jgi:hypothetical protein
MQSTTEYKTLATLKVTKFPTLLKSDAFQTEDKPLEDKFKFSEMYYSVYGFTKKIDEIILDKFYQKDLYSIYEPVGFTTQDLNLIDDCINEVARGKFSVTFCEILGSSPFKFADEWKKLSKYFNGQSKLETLKTLFFIFIDLHQGEVGTKLSDYDKNILLWTAFLHKIAKHIAVNEALGENFPEEEVEDNIYAFKSAAVALNIFLKNNYFSFDESQSAKVISLVEATSTLFLDSNNLKEEKNGRKIYEPSFKHLKEIFANFNALAEINTNNKFVIDIITLIAFNQSLPITDKENADLIFSSKRIVELMRILVVNGSAADTLFAKDSHTAEINEAFDQLHQ